MFLIDPMSVNRIIEKYIDYKEKLTLIEQGDWRKNPQLQQMSLQQIENIRFIVEELDKTIISKIARFYKKSN